MGGESTVPGDLRGRLEVVHGHSPSTDGVLQTEQPGSGEVRVIRFHGRRDVLRVQRPVRSMRQRLGLNASEHGRAATFPPVRVGHLTGDVFVSATAVGQQSAQVALCPRGDEQRGLESEEPGDPLLERVDGGVITEDVVPHLGLGHGPAHGLAGPSDGVAAQIDEVTGLVTGGVRLVLGVGNIDGVSGAGAIGGRHTHTLPRLEGP